MVNSKESTPRGELPTMKELREQKRTNPLERAKEKQKERDDRKVLVSQRTLGQRVRRTTQRAVKGIEGGFEKGAGKVAPLAQTQGTRARAQADVRRTHKVVKTRR